MDGDGWMVMDGWMDDGSIDVQVDDGWIEV